jgi:hypothetical protein
MERWHRVSELTGIDLREKALKLIITWIRRGFYYVELGEGKKNSWVWLHYSCPDAEDDYRRQYLNSTTTWSENSF